jgi:hypothetical protein
LKFLASSAPTIVAPFLKQALALEEPQSGRLFTKDGDLISTVEVDLLVTAGALSPEGRRACLGGPAVCVEFGAEIPFIGLV